MKKKIIIIDKDKWNARVVSSYLIQWSMETLTFTNCSEGLAGIVNSVPDMIIIDIQANDINPLIAIQVVRKIDATKEIPILVSSSNLNREILRSALSYGASGALSKPFSQKTLFEKISSVISTEEDEEIEEDDDFINIDISALSDELIEK